MKMVMYYKGFKIKETNNREREEGLHSYNFYVVKNNMEEFEGDCLKECLDFIDTY